MLLICYSYIIINPFTAQDGKISGLTNARTPLRNSVCSGPITHLLSVLCVWMKILSHASAEKKIKRLRTFILVFFKWYHGSDGVNSVVAWRGTVFNECCACRCLYQRGTGQQNSSTQSRMISIQHLVFHRLTVIYVLFCSLKKGLPTKICTSCFCRNTWRSI